MFQISLQTFVGTMAFHVRAIILCNVPFFQKCCTFLFELHHNIFGSTHFSVDFKTNAIIIYTVI